MIYRFNFHTLTGNREETSIAAKIDLRWRNGARPVCASGSVRELAPQTRLRSYTHGIFGLIVTGARLYPRFTENCLRTAGCVCVYLRDCRFRVSRQVFYRALAPHRPAWYHARRLFRGTTPPPPLLCGQLQHRLRLRFTLARG